MNRKTAVSSGLALTIFASGARADALTGEVARQALNPLAIAMFLVFVFYIPGVAVWPARRGTPTPRHL
ncbi:hypothetical protein [Neorhizobium galegae]|uniref:hypothetical protein n=1 Tax=Neorhizobium galegae TaxID=399 RepID=UPI002105BCF5|nr:hypothetical protein [Neorhizobium galegae]MCQ1856078.1 hypothetical protein [Neorhizobium galegae]